MAGRVMLRKQEFSDRMGHVDERTFEKEIERDIYSIASEEKKDPF